VVLEYEPIVTPSPEACVISGFSRKSRQASLLNKDDLNLARGMLMGDEKALREFVNYYMPRLYRFTLTRVRRDVSLAEEIVQDTLAIAARRIETYRGEASLLTWLMQICRRELIRTMNRDAKRQAIITLPEDDNLMRAVIESMDTNEHHQPFENCEREDLARLVQNCLDELPERYALALEWKYIEGMSTVEIASRMEISSAATDSVLARARRSFRDGFSEIFAQLDLIDKPDIA